MSPHLAAALAAAAATVPPERVDRVWVFPARRTGDRETGLAVLAVYPEDGAGSERRGVWTLGYEAEPPGGAKTGRTDTLTEQAVAPAGRVERVIDGVLRRLGTEAEAPRLHPVEGDPRRWAELLAGAGIRLDSCSQE